MELLTDKQFCKRFNLSRITTWTHRKDGSLPYRLIGNRVHYSEDDVREWFENLKLKAIEHTKRLHTPEKVCMHCGNVLRHNAILRTPQQQNVVKRRIAGRPPNIEKLERKRTVTDEEQCKLLV